MSKKTKIILFSIIGVAVVLFVVAFIINSNKTYTIKFDTNGGSYVSVQEVRNGDVIREPENPTKEGYEFVEWDYKNKKYDFSTIVKENMTLVAKWEKAKLSYDVELVVDDKKQIISVKDGETIDIEKLTFEKKEGFEIEWQLNGKTIDIETEKITSNITLTGKYTVVKVYTVKFDTDGGNKIENIKVNENKTVKKPNEPTKDGYVFDDWYLDNKKYDFSSKVVKDITLKAKWIEDKNVKRYTVTFDTDGGSKVDSQIVIDGKTVNKPNNPTKNGYTFVEWQLNGKVYNFNTKVTSNITLKATWKQVINYTVSFNTDGGTTYPSQTVEDGKKATNPGNPTKNGYVFTGWDFDFNTPITSNKTINAKWREAYQYTVSFNLNGGNCANCHNQTITEGGKATNPGSPTKSGYTFNGWDFDFNNVVTSNVTVNAKWIAKIYTVYQTSVDEYSPEVRLSVKEGNNNVSFKSIRYLNTTTEICNSNLPIANKNDLVGINQVTVILTDDTAVVASIG